MLHLLFYSASTSSIINISCIECNCGPAFCVQIRSSQPIVKCLIKDPQALLRLKNHFRHMHMLLDNQSVLKFVIDIFVHQKRSFNLFDGCISYINIFSMGSLQVRTTFPYLLHGLQAFAQQPVEYSVISARCIRSFLYWLIRARSNRTLSVLIKYYIICGSLAGQIDVPIVCISDKKHYLNNSMMISN